MQSNNIYFCELEKCYIEFKFEQDIYYMSQKYCQNFYLPGNYIFQKIQYSKYIENQFERHYLTKPMNTFRVSRDNDNFICIPEVDILVGYYKLLSN